MTHLKMKVTLFGALLTFALSALLELGAAHAISLRDGMWLIIR